MPTSIEPKNNISEMKFLEEHKEESIYIFLVNGNRIECRILGYDDHCLIASVKGSNKSLKQLIYKTAIASICMIP